MINNCTSETKFTKPVIWLLGNDAMEYEENVEKYMGSRRYSSGRVNIVNLPDLIHSTLTKDYHSRIDMIITND